MDAQLQSIPITKIKTRGTNPRTLFEEAKLKELAADISVHGILQPLIVRKAGDRFDLVAGERRLRAATIAELKEVPALVRELTDLEADEIQLVENAQRVDLHYVEEADAFERLRSVHSLDVAQIAAKTGKKPGYVKHILKLAGLSPTVKKAAMERNSLLSIGHASLIARVNDPKFQGQFLSEILAGDHSNKPLRVKDAEKLLESTYQIALTKADFNINDPDLYPDAASCSACPFNTTNLDRSLYAEKEICTRPSCFKEKQRRRFDQIAATSKNEGLNVIKPAKAAASIFYKGRDDVRYESGYINVDESHYYSDFGHKTLRSILKAEAMPEMSVTRGPSDKTLYLVNRKDAEAALDKIRRRRSHQQSLRSPAKTAAQKKADQNDKAGKQASRATVLQIVAAVEEIEVDDKLRKPLLALLKSLSGHLHEEDLVRALKRREIINASEGKGYDARKRAIKTFFAKHATKLTAPQLLSLCIEATLGYDHYHRFSSSPFNRLTAIAAMFKVNPTALKSQALREIQAAARAKSKKTGKSIKRGAK